MNSEQTPREALAKFEPVDPSFTLASAIFPDGFIDSSREYATDAVIAHLWSRAESPEVVEAVRDRIKSIANDPHIKDRYQMYAEVVLETTLTELIGPKPEGRHE